MQIYEVKAEQKAHRQKQARIGEEISSFFSECRSRRQWRSSRAGPPFVFCLPQSPLVGLVFGTAGIVSAFLISFCGKAQRPKRRRRAATANSAQNVQRVFVPCAIDYAQRSVLMNNKSQFKNKTFDYISFSNII